MSDQDFLSKAPEGWLESTIPLLTDIALELADAETADEVLRKAVILARERLQFGRIGAWLFEDDRKSAVGAFGVDENGELSDERGFRIFDRTGMIGVMYAEWTKPPHFFLRRNAELRSAKGEVPGRGIHVTVPLIHDGEYKGFLAADDLLHAPAINDKVGHLLLQYAHVMANAYYQKRAKERLAKAERACERAERMKSEFLGMMGHEIRTPLNAIMGYAQLLGMKPTVERAKSLSRTIEDCGEHLTELINGILEYAQLSDSELKSLYRPCDPVEVISSAIASFQHAFDEKRVSLEYSYRGVSPRRVLADALGLRQILNNLLQNALKFTESGTVRVALQSQAKSQGSTEFFVTVEDEGIGMDPTAIEEIFKPFKQLDSSLTRKVGGIGMGLAIVDRLVAAMKGKLECSSVPGVGTKFQIDFVFGDADAAKSEGTSPTSAGHAKSIPQGARARILVAEDHHQSMEVLLSMLEALGYSEPDTAKNGALAKEALLNRPYDLLLLDVEMPEIDGLELTRQIRGGKCGPINKDVIIIGITAFAMEVNRETCLIAGMNDYIVKPLRIPILQRSLESSLAKT